MWAYKTGIKTYGGDQSMKKERNVQTGLRISESLRNRLAREAKRSGVSLNSEIERRLEESFSVSTKELGERVEEISRKIDTLNEAWRRDK
jgi:hypothetical protein